MTPNQIRAAAPVGSNRTVRLSNGSRILLTVVQYGRDGMIAGCHPDLLQIPYESIQEVLR